MRHGLGSRWGLGVLVALLAVSAVFVLARTRDDVTRLAERSTVSRASLVATVALAHANLHELAVAGDMSNESRADLSADVATLISSGQLQGLEIWAWDGRLIYADTGHNPDESRMPDAELDRSHEGKTWTKPSQDGRGREGQTYQVFVPRDADGDGTLDVIIEVLLPSVPILHRAEWLWRLWIGGLLLVVALLAAGLGRWSRRRAALARQALRDRLTGLINRAGLREELVRIGSGNSTTGSAALLVLDLEKFRLINDTLGYPAGDGLLRQVAHVLLAGARPQDAVARIGGDAFALLMADLPDPASAVSRGRQLLERLESSPYVLDGVDLTIEASMGIALLGVHGDDPDVLLQRADVAMFKAKREGSGVVVYDPAIDGNDVSQLALLTELRHAIKHDELVLHYQPKAWLASGALAGVEALIRWQHPARGLIGPDQFIPLAENTGLIHPLTQWVLDTAIQQASRWRDAGLMLPIAVNISPRSLLQEDFPGTVVKLLAAHGVSADLLEIEIIETSVISDPERAIQACRLLDASGLRISIDDFGAGYTSLSYLKKLPVETLKIDRAFVTDLLTDHGDRAIAQSIIELGQRLGLSVLAEGIESQEIWTALTQLGCDQGQGYYFARPMPPQALQDWILEKGAADLLGRR